MIHKKFHKTKNTFHICIIKNYIFKTRFKKQDRDNLGVRVTSRGIKVNMNKKNKKVKERDNKSLMPYMSFLTS